MLLHLIALTVLFNFVPIRADEASVPTDDGEAVKT
jgi:hypothetical protein